MRLRLLPLHPTWVLLCSLALALAAPVALAQAKVQVVHNSPDPAAAVVDIYINGGLAIDDLAFRKATPYVDLDPGPTEIIVAPGTSTSSADGLATFTFDLADGEFYQLFATGVLDPTLFEANPEGVSTAFTLLVNTPAKTMSPRFNRVEGNAVHGAPDAPTVKLSVREFYTGRAATVGYTDISRYYVPKVRDYIIDVTAGDAVIAAFYAPAESFEAGGLAGTVAASGFLTPENEPAGSKAFRLIAIAPDGRVGQLRPAPLRCGCPGGGASSEALPTAFALGGVAPNPLATTATVRIDLPADAEVTVRVYDLLGREVLAVPAQALVAGTAQRVSLDASGLAAGTYVYRVEARTGAETDVRTGRLTVVN